jgi:LytR cell envelope-related transcriptional attenuator
MRRFGFVLLFLAALVAAGFAGAVISGHLRTTTSTPTTTVVRQAQPATTTTVAHSSVKVVVANGTQESNVAAHFTQQLQQQGWNVATPTNTTSPATTTTIYWAPGQQGSAAVIAQELGVAQSALQALTSSAPLSNATTYNVVVVIGPDLAGQGFPPTTQPAT